MSYSFEEESEDQLAIQDDLEMLRQDLMGELQPLTNIRNILSLGDEEAATTLEHIIE